MTSLTSSNYGCKEPIKVILGLASLKIQNQSRRVKSQMMAALSDPTHSTRKVKKAGKEGKNVFYGSQKMNTDWETKSTAGHEMFSRWITLLLTLRSVIRFMQSNEQMKSNQYEEVKEFNRIDQKSLSQECTPFRHPIFKPYKPVSVQDRMTNIQKSNRPAHHVQSKQLNFVLLTYHDRFITH